MGGRKLPNIRSHNHLEGTATDAVHLTRYSNAAVIINLKEANADKNVRDRLTIIDTVIISNNTRKLNCPSFFNRRKSYLLVVLEACITHAQNVL